MSRPEVPGAAYRSPQPPSPSPSPDPFMSRRVSVNSVGAMPIITEDGLVHPAYPRMPLRIPQKNPRRSLVPSPSPTYPHSPSSSTYASSSHAVPLDDKEAAIDKETTTDFDSSDGVPATPIADLVPEEKVWLASRKRSCRFIAAVLIVLLLIIGLAVGLSVGITKKNSGVGGGMGTDSDPDDSSSSSSVFPAGSYSFDATLRDTQANCTSRASTWGCSLDHDGSPDFSWAVQQAPKSSKNAYIISSTNNPFGPNFKNLPLKVLDAHRTSERLVFTFSMNKTVVPSDAQTPANRAAKCKYTDTTFEATLWTRQKGRKAIDPPKKQFDFAVWPGDVEITQVKKSDIGEPACVDVRDSPIADVQASGLGDCECRYANFDTSSK